MRKQQLLAMILFLCLGLPAMAQFHGAEVQAKIGDEAFYTSYKPANAQFWTGVGQLVGGGALAGYSFYRDCTTYNGTTSVDGAKNVKFAHLYTWPITGEIFGAATAVFGIYDIIAGVKNNDSISKEILDLWQNDIALGIVGLVNIFDTEVVVSGREVSSTIMQIVGLKAKSRTGNRIDVNSVDIYILYIASTVEI